ncbi:MAG: hypothetical protein MI744_18380, partial [Pseudomonadales bacterium]|nr:hypothetical protein [Pseudomonadales bacterium]
TLDNDNLTAVTHYKHPLLDTHGELWKSIYAMHKQSTAMLDTIDQRMQLATWEAARSNIRSSRDAGGILLPLELDVPIMKGHFYDFERPIKRGLLPGYDNALIADSTYIGFGDIDNPVENRGPWDTVFGWRYINLRKGGVSTSTGGPGSPPIRKQVTSTYKKATKYGVYGPQSWLIRKLFDSYSMDDPSALHLFDEYIRQFSSIKLGMLFGGPSVTYREPDWEIDIERDNTRMNDNNIYCRRDYERGRVPNRDHPEKSMYLVCEMKSRYDSNPGASSAQGITWNYIQRNGRPYPYIAQSNTYHIAGTNGPENIDGQYIRSRHVINPHVYQIKAWYQTDPNDFENGG